MSAANQTLTLSPVINDVIAGVAWSPESVAAFEGLFKALAEFGVLDAEATLGFFHGIVSETDRACVPLLGPGHNRVRLSAIRDAATGTLSLQIILAKDNETLQQIIRVITTGQASPAVIRLGPFVPPSSAVIAMLGHSTTAN
jgi:hypothetical protein